MSLAALLQAANLRVMPVDQTQTAYHSGRAAQQRLYDLLVPLFPAGNVYPDTAHDLRSFPDCVYSVNDTGALAFRGIDVSHSTLFGLSLRDVDQANLVELFDRVAQALHPQPGIQIIGWATGYDDQTAAEGNYVIGVEVLVSHPVGFDDADAEQPYPLLLLPAKETGLEANSDNCGTQSVMREHHIIYHAATQEALSQRRRDVQQAIHFQLLSNPVFPAFRPLEFVSGEPLDAEGGLFAWVDVWRDVYRMRPARNP